MRPNIVFFFTDQQRGDTVNERVTPNLLKLAEDGRIFDNAFTCQPVCGPARSCLQLGQYATNTGCFVNGIPLPTDRKTIADYLNDAGYETAYVGKWHLASGMGPSAPHYEKTAVPVERRGGYKDFWAASDVLEFTSNGRGGYVFDKDGNKLEFEGVRADKITDFALDYIENKTSDAPFFLFLSHIEPHHQNSTDSFECPDGYRQRFENEPIPEDLKAFRGNYGGGYYADYLGCCHALDENLGRLVELLKRKGIYDDTVIIFTSDHGCHFKTRNWEYKRSCHESSIHIPLVIKGAKNAQKNGSGDDFIGGGREDAMVSLLDMPATILDFAGIGVPDDFESRSVRRISENPRDHVFLQISESQIGRCVRTKQYKYSVRSRLMGLFKPAADVYFEDFLYDLEKDPHELNNLIKDKNYEQIRAELRQILLDDVKKAENKEPKIKKKTPFIFNLR